MTDILSTATVTTIKADGTKIITAVDSTENGVITFIKAHYTAFAFIIVGIVAVLLWKVL